MEDEGDAARGGVVETLLDPPPTLRELSLASIRAAQNYKKLGRARP